MIAHRKKPARRRRTRAPRHIVVRTFAAAASVMGYSTSFLKQLRDVGAIGFKASGRIDVSALQAWMIENVAMLPVAEHWKDALGVEKLRGEKRRNDHDEGLLVSRASVAEHLQRAFRPTFGRIEQFLANEYPAKIVGLDVPAARIYGRRIFDMVLDAHRQAALPFQT
jgi:hypothetical protein